MTLRSRLLLAGAERTVRRADRERRRELQRELAAYGSAADRADLAGMLDRAPDGSTHEVRALLADQGRRPRRSCGGLAA